MFEFRPGHQFFVFFFPFPPDNISYVNLIKPRPLTHNSLLIFIESSLSFSHSYLTSFYLLTVGEESYCYTISHSVTRIHTILLLLLALTTQNTHERQSCMHPARFKPANPASESQQTDATDRTAVSSNHSTRYSLESY